MSLLNTARSTSALQEYLNAAVPQTDPLAYKWETNDVGSSAQRTVVTEVPALENAVNKVDVPRLGLWTDATLRVHFTAAAESATNTWGALGHLAVAELCAKGGKILNTLWADQIIDWVTSLESGAYKLWKGKRHLLNGPKAGTLAAGDYVALIPLPFSHLRRLHYLYTPWLEELEVSLHTSQASDWATNVTVTRLEMLWDFRELAPDVLHRRAVAALRAPVTPVVLHYDSYRESDTTVVASHSQSSPLTHYSTEVPLTCPFNVFRILLLIKSSGTTLSTLDVRALLRVRLYLGDQSVYDANGPMLLKHMVTAPYRHHSRGAAVFALQFSSEPHHTPDAHSGQSGFISLAHSVDPRLVIDTDPAYVTAGSTVLSVTHLFYTAEAVNTNGGQLMQSQMI